MNYTPELKDYAIIGDCRSAALISRYGSIDWLCLPDFDSPSIFARLLDEEKGGCFLITLADITSTSRRYLPDTAILETTITNSMGSIRITDAMPAASNSRKNPMLEPLREILRHVEIISGNPELVVMLDAKPNYAKEHGRFHNRGKLGWTLYYGQNILNLISDASLEENNGILSAIIQAAAGENYWFSLTFDNSHPAVLLPLGESAQKRLQETASWWQTWSSQCSYTGKWRDLLIRSAITLRLMIFAPSGALLAAITTSLPERPGGDMNWDYRYCWPRDAALTLSAFIDCGFHEESYAFFGWLMTAAHTTRPRLSNMYNVYGCYKIDEKILSHLKGYHDAKPVRIGNKVAHQLQHDVYGEVMLAVEDWIHHFGKPTHPGRKLIEGFGRALMEHWDKPDNGIWELRDTRRHYTYSKVMGWYVIDSLIRLHEKGYIRIPYEQYKQQCVRMRETIDKFAFDEKRNCYTGVFDSETMDASLLLLPRTGYISYADPRMKNTWKAIKQDLDINGLILRYPPGFAHTKPGEGALVVCNFWAIDYLSQSGQLEEAEERLERLLSMANDVGLFNEAIDTKTYEPLGNMPQSFSHAGLINSVLILERMKREKR